VITETTVIPEDQRTVKRTPKPVTLTHVNAEDGAETKEGDKDPHPWAAAGEASTTIGR